ncbi:MAG: VOC family protein [Emcibacter sp.]|nr:VOC family protein [Emcibacter sp.]
MKFKYSIFYVENVKETIEFYNRAFGFETRFLHESGDFGELDTGETSLSFSSVSLMKQLGKAPGKPEPSAPVFEIAFETNDVEGSLKKAIDAGAILVQGVRQEPWGQTTSYVSDPNGYLVEICSPVKVET